MKSIFSGLILAVLALQVQAQTLGDKVAASPYYSRYKAISFMPIQLIGNTGDQVDVCVGLRYERTLKNKELSVSLPLSRSMTNNMTYFAPGLKVFLSQKQLVRFFTMPQLYTAFGYGEWATFKNQSGSPFIEYREAFRYKIGFVMNIGFDLLISERLFLDASYGWGLNYYDRFPAMLNNIDQPQHVSPMFQASCGIGYKF